MLVCGRMSSLPLFKGHLTVVAEMSLSGEDGVRQCFSTFLLQRNLPQIFALLMEPYATVKQWYFYNRIELWLRITSQVFNVFFEATPGSQWRNPG